MRLFLIRFLWCLLVSLVLNAGWILLRAVRTFRNLDVKGAAAVAFSFCGLLAYTVLGDLILSLVSFLVRRMLVSLR